MVVEIFVGYREEQEKGQKGHDVMPEAISHCSNPPPPPPPKGIKNI